MHMAHKSEKSSGVSKSSSDWLNYTGFPGDVCRVLCRTQRRVAKEESGVFTTVMTNAYQGQLNAGFSKVCEIFNLY